MQGATESQGQDLVMTREFDAPRPLVWRCWTEAELFQQWYGPQGFTIPQCTIDLRVGGKLLFCMRSPEGYEMWLTGTFQEIDPVERLVKTESMADAEGNVVAIGPGPHDTLVTVTLEAEGESRTRITLRHAGLPEGSAEAGANEGYRGAFDKLAAFLEKERA
ncbi:MAG: SRPBCC domain-containing protein [Chloroflexi bacterium]|nr:SRPBCC domain-containing protein [Chloroflexota bacterium]